MVHLYDASESMIPSVNKTAYRIRGNIETAATWSDKGFLYKLSKSLYREGKILLCMVVILVSRWCCGEGEDHANRSCLETCI